MPLATPKELDLAYDHERLGWLRRRFYLYAWLSFGLSAVGLLTSGVFILLLAVDAVSEVPDAPVLESTLFWASQTCHTFVAMAAFLLAIAWVRRAQPARKTIIRLIYWLFVGSHFVEMAHVLWIGLVIDPSAAMGNGLSQTQANLFIAHLITSFLIPWTVRESFRPLIPVIIAHILIITLFTSEPMENRVFGLILLGLIGLPGMAICWFKQRRFQHGFEYRSYKDAFHYVSREVQQARELHESFFPTPITDGPLRLDFEYLPMSQLGGDYIHARVFPGADGQPASLLCAVIDVTGHGLTATLTANHLHALLKRLTSTNHIPDPGELIDELNRYMHESFSGLSVFATAICIRIDLKEQRVVWASAGHPPGFLVSAGHCEPALESTACLLGVIEPELYDANTQQLSISDSVSIFAYTDGATEFPLPDGGMLGIVGLAQRVAEASKRGDFSCKNMMAQLTGLSTYERQDDILLVQLGIWPERKPTSQGEQSPTSVHTGRESKTTA